MPNAGCGVPLPVALARAAALDGLPHAVDAHGGMVRGITSPPLSTLQLLGLVRTLRLHYMQLVAEVAAPCVVAADSLDPVSRLQTRLDAVAHSVAELQDGIRSKSTQCARAALHLHLTKEVEMRRRILSRMEAALGIARQSV